MARAPQAGRSRGGGARGRARGGRALGEASVCRFGLACAALLVGACAGPAGDGTPDETGGAAVAPAGGEGAGAAIDLAGVELVDLTHAFGPETVYWPTAPSTFELDTLARGVTEAGWFYSANLFSTPEHGGTHMDAPVHFAEGALDAASVPLERLVGPAVVIDITARAAADPDYALTPGDVRAFEAEHGTIEAGAIVLLRTGWSARWPDPERYLGPSAPEDASDLHFPSYGEEAARLLIEERGVAALGVDVASTDIGASTEFPVHRLAGPAGIPGFENLTNLDRLPPTGSVVVALPMKIEGGSGGPLRAIAMVPR